MCSCASCEHTDSFRDKGFAAWPRGEPAGKRASERAYAAHVAHARLGASSSIAFSPGQPAIAARLPGLVHNVQPNATAIRWNAGKKASPVFSPEPARPTQPGKAGRHFPARDRPRETAIIYAMPKSKDKARPIGRPPIPGRRVVIKLEEEQIKRAEKLGGGNVAAGIRKALAQSG